MGRRLKTASWRLFTCLAVSATGLCPSGVHAGSKPDPSLCASPAGSLSELEDFSLSTLGLVSTGSSPPSPPPPLEYCVGVEPAQKSVRASTSASAAYLNEQLLAAIDRAASHPRADTSLAVIDPRKPLVRFTRAGTIELSNVDVSIQVVSKLEDTLIRIFGRGGGFWGTVKARPTLELKPVHTKNGIGFKLVRFKINGTAYDSAGTDISNLAALVGFPKDKAGKLTASDAQVKSAIDGLLSGLQEKFASTLIGLTASGTSASKILATRYDSKGKTATVGFDPKVLGKVGPVFDVDQFGIRGGRLVLGARSEESVEAIAKRNYSMTIDQEGLGQQIGRATSGSAGFQIWSGTQIGGTFGVGSKDKFIRVRGELNDSNVDIQVFITSTRENRITLIPGEVKIQNGNASMAYDAAAMVYGDAAAQEIAQNKMVDAVAAGLSRQFAVDHMERSGTVLQIYLNPRLAVGSKARFNLKSIRTKSNALSLAYGLDLRNLPPAARCRQN